MTVSVTEAARILSCHPHTIYRLLRQRTLEGRKFRNSWRVSKAQIERLKEEQRALLYASPAEKVKHALESMRIVGDETSTMLSVWRVCEDPFLVQLFHANEAYKEALGHSKRKLRELLVGECTHPDDLPIVEEACRVGRHQHEVRLLTQGGNLWVRSTSYAIDSCDCGLVVVQTERI